MRTLDLDSVQVQADRVRTPRLELVLATPEMLRADLEGSAALAAALDGWVQEGSWPCGEWDADALRWTLDLLASGRAAGGWSAWYWLRAADRMLVGAGGFKGPPDDSGTVEIGYSVVESARLQGIASEGSLGLTAFAFAHPAVRRVAAETYPHLAGSLGVMRRLGMVPVEGASEEGVVRYAVERPI